MINGKKTKREMKMENDMKLLGNWEARVINTQTIEDNGRGKSVKITTEYSSLNGDTLDSITHKIKLDMITNLKYGFENPVGVAIRKVGNGIIADEMNVMEN